MNARLGGVQIATTSPHVKAGKLVAYATTGEQRAPQLPEVPEVPTLGELGPPQLTTTVWFGFFGPKNLPPAIMRRLTEAHQQLTASPDFKVRMAGSGLSVSPSICGDKFLKQMEQETVRWARIVKATGFVADN